MKAKQFLRKLQAVGVQIEPSRGKGGHYRLVWGVRWTIFAFHGSQDIGPTVLKSTCKQLGLDWREVL